MEPKAGSLGLASAQRTGLWRQEPGWGPLLQGLPSPATCFHGNQSPLAGAEFHPYPTPVPNLPLSQ